MSNSDLDKRRIHHSMEEYLLYNPEAGECKNYLLSHEGAVMVRGEGSHGSWPGGYVMVNMLEEKEVGKPPFYMVRVCDRDDGDATYETNDLSEATGMLTQATSLYFITWRQLEEIGFTIWG